MVALPNVIGRRGVLYCTLTSLLLAGASYYLCLRYIHPGYFHPLYPHHVDFYWIPGIAYDLENWRSYVTWARPLGFSTFFLLGQFGLHGFILSFVIICLLNSALTVSLVRRVLDHPIPLFGVLLFFFSVFSHPYFYLNYVHDGFATLSFLYLICTMHFWVAFLAKRGRWSLIACAALIGMMCFTKETYFVSLALFWLFQLWLNKGETRKTAAYLLSFSLLCMGVSVVSQILGRSPFVDPRADTGSAYAIDFSLPTNVRIYLTYVKTLFSPGAALLVFVSFLLSSAEPKRLCQALMFLCMGLSAYLPHAVLPHHVILSYSWVGAMFCFGVCLFIPSSSLQISRAERLRFPLKLRPVLTTLLLASLAYWGWRGNGTKYAATRWNIDQEIYNRNLLTSFPKLKGLSPAVRNILVTGLDRPFHPFLVPPFVCTELGEDRRWTVVIPEGEDERRMKAPIPFKRDCVQFRQVSRINLLSFDYVIGFDNEGMLVSEMDRSRLSQIGNSPLGDLGEIDCLLFPSVKALSQRLKNAPSDWLLWQEIGIEFWRWKLTKPATRSFETAIELSQSNNPYPFYFLAQIKEFQQDYCTSLRLYERAVAVDKSSLNPAFQIALERVRRHGCQ